MLFVAPSIPMRGRDTIDRVFVRGLCVLFLLSTAALLGACDSNNESEFPPISVYVGVDRTLVASGGAVYLSGSAISHHGRTLSYAWTQVSGPTVNLIIEGQTAVASFTAAATLLGGADCVPLVFRLTATDSAGNGLSADTTLILAAKSGLSACPLSVNSLGFRLSGQVTYARVPHASNYSLNHAATYTAPARGVRVELISASASTMVTKTDSAGMYSFAGNIEAQSVLRVRAVAELDESTADPSWYVAVSDTSQAYPYPVYALGMQIIVPQPSSGVSSVDITGDLHAASGWGVNANAYTDLPAAAPFAILDSIYGALQGLATVSAFSTLPPITVSWTPDYPESGSYYDGQFLVIASDLLSDSDAYDSAVVIHELGHYLEDSLSRSDNTGGRHYISGARADMRLAFSEGLASAWGAILSGDVLYQDANVNGGFGFSVETISNSHTNAGWYSELSMIYLLYDLMDSQNDGVDLVSLGMEPLYDVLLNEHRTGAPYNSIFTFITALKAKNPAQASAIDSLVSSQAINSAAIDVYGSNETNSAGTTGSEVLPIYTQLPTAGSSTPDVVCTSTRFSLDGGTTNQLSNRRFFRLSASANTTYDIAMELMSGTLPEGTTPFLLLKEDAPASTCVMPSNSLACFASGANSSFRFTSTGGGTHVMELVEYPGRAPNAGSTCYHITTTRR